MKLTTIKATSLAYRQVGTGGMYSIVSGVLKGLSIIQDNADSTEIASETNDVPFDIFYKGKPISFNFELTNYELTDLPVLFGGHVEVNDETGNREYISRGNSFTSEFEWRITFAKGLQSLVIPRGQTIGTMKKDQDGALNFSITINSLVFHTNDGKDVLYKLNANIVDSPVVMGDTVVFGYEENEYPYVEDNTVIFDEEGDIPEVIDGNVVFAGNLV